jgi:hypothetical protein
MRSRLNRMGARLTLGTSMPEGRDREVLSARLSSARLREIELGTGRGLAITRSAE